MPGRIDLHTHTKHSDGVLSPHELLSLARESKLKAIAITDHDTVSGFLEYLAYKENFGVEVIPGIEIGIKNDDDRGFKEVHMLGFFCDYTSKTFLSTLDKLNESKRNWLHRQVNVLNEIGLEFTEEQVKVIAEDATPRRPHIWRVIEAKNLGKIAMKEFYERTSYGGDLYVKREFELSLEDCVRLMKIAGGIPVLAHPGFYDLERVVKECADAGIDGIEVNYNYQALGKQKTLEIVTTVDKLADKYNLLKTGGSDFHDNIHGSDIGTVNVPYSFLEKLKKHAGK